MIYRFLLCFLVLALLGCEPFSLERRAFPVCTPPTADIGITSDRLDVTFFLDKPQGDITVAGWDPGDGKGVNRAGQRVTYNYAQAGTYLVTLVLVNGCDDKFTKTRQITLSK